MLARFGAPTAAPIWVVVVVNMGSPPDARKQLTKQPVRGKQTFASPYVNH